MGLASALLSSAVLAAMPMPLDKPASDDLQYALGSRLLAVESAGQNLIAVGRRGHILLSQDGGESWQQQPVPVASDLVDSHFVTAQVGFAVGHDGLVLKSQDGGKTWEKVLDGRQAAALIGEFRQANPDLSEDALFEYERFESEGSDKPFLTVHFTDERHGVVLGAFNFGFATNDGGQSWVPFSHRIENPMGYHLYAAFEHQGVLHVAGEKGLLLRWDEASQRLAALQSPYDGSWFGALSLGENIVLFGLRGSAYFGSPEAGWTSIELPTDDSFNAAMALSADSLLLLGQSGRVFRVRIDRAQARYDELKSPGMPLYDAELSGDAVVVVGARGVRQLSLEQAK